MIYGVDQDHCRDYGYSSNREWLLTNGQGGYAMGTVSGANTRRYHGHLVAETTPWSRRMVLLSNVEAFVQSDGAAIGLSTNQYQGVLHPTGYEHIEQFQSGSYCVWRFRANEMMVQKRLALHSGSPACTLEYVNEGFGPIQLVLRPLVCHKFYHSNFGEAPSYPERIAFPRSMTVVSHGELDLTLYHPDALRVPVQGWYYRFENAREAERGLDARDDLYCPCELRYELSPGEKAILVASTTEETNPYVFGPLSDFDESSNLIGTPGGPTIVAGYPWFTDWGRDTMISLPGLCLSSGRNDMAREILSSRAALMKQGLIPNRSVEAGQEPEYNTADASLWFVNAVYLTLIAEWDQPFAEAIAKKLQELVDWHVRGTLFGIKVDSEDGLLTQGEEGIQLTWMDAKVGDWVVTPRHGKPVEVNGLWINALRCIEWIFGKLGLPTEPIVELAERAELSFDGAFWKESLDYYLDTADPMDASLRPNQVIAMSLPFGPAKGEHAVRALDRVTTELLTPKGLRTLAPSDPKYRGRFEGPLTERDAAYHQGTAWPWLLGPYAEAVRKLKGEHYSFDADGMLAEYGIGGIAEVYDGDEPQRPGGCPWQAWSYGVYAQSR